MTSVLHQKFPGAHIVSIISHIRETGLNQLNYKVLKANVDVVYALGIKLSPTCSEELAIFVQWYVNNVDNFQDSYVSDLKEIRELILSILGLQETPEKLLILKSGLISVMTNVQALLAEFKTDDEVCRNLQLSRYLKLINMFMTYIDDNNLSEAVTEEMNCRLDKLIVYFLVEEEKYLLPHALSLFMTYIKVMKHCILLHQALTEMIDRTLSDESYAKVYIMVISFFIDSSFKDDNLSRILNTEKFWAVLRKCCTDESCERKHMNHILKFLTLNSSHQTSVDGIWNEQYLKSYQSWWKKYFAISEILEEKQTHLVLPVFSLVSDLLDDPVVQIDIFWILILFQSSLKHDSRTVRVNGFLCFLKVRHDVYKSTHFPILLKLLLNTANDSALYRKLFKTHQFDGFENSVITWINNFVSDEETCFFELLFSVLSEIKWSPVPLYYILDFLIKSNIQPCLDMRVTSQLKDTISNVKRFHNIVIRGAIQCSYIRFVTKICKCKLEELTYLFDFVSYFSDEECLLRGIHEWSVVVEYLRTVANYQSVEKLITEKLTSQIECGKRSSIKILLPLARDVLLMHDSFGALDRSFQNRIENMIFSFSSALQNAYSPTRVLDNYLMLLAEIYSMVRNDSKVRSSYVTLPTIVTTLEENSASVFSYIIQRMMKSENNAELLDFYESCLQKFNGCIKSFSKNYNSVSLIKEWWNKSIINWHTRKNLSAYCCTKIFLWILGIVETNMKLCRVGYVDDINIVIKNFIEDEKPLFQNMNCDASNITSNFGNTMWSIFELSLKVNSTKFFQHFEVSSVFEFVLDTFDWIRKENLFLVLKTLKHLLSIEIALKSEKIVLQLMDDSWKRVEEIHSTPYYTDCLKYWIYAFFQKSVLQMKAYQKKIEQYMNMLLKMVGENGGQNFQFLVFVLNEYESMDNLFEVFPQACDILINIYCVTHLNRKDQRMEYRTEDHIRSKSTEISVNQLKKFDANDSSEVMRMKALNIILKLRKIEEKFISICLKFIRSLVTIDKNSRKRYFNDSIIHRIKHKKLQLLLIIEAIAFQKSNFSSNSLELPNTLYHFAVNCLLTEPHQPSVRYMLEWLLIRIILHYSSSFCEKFWNSFSEASEERIGSICSFISVAFHVSNVNKNDLFVNQAIKLILPWTMGQHFNARLYAQTVLVRLINMRSSLKEKYKMIEESLNNCLKKGNAVKNSVKLQQDFYFCSFHPINHFSFLMILWDLPRLSGICREEWLPKNLYGQYLHVEADCEIPLCHHPDLFSPLSSASWIAKATSTAYYSENEVTFGREKDISHDNFAQTQKKFIPVETPSNVESSNLLKNTPQLIVVASLIDRAPNLGGLTRTCEIFAVSQLVVNNLDVISSKEFTSLSITAEKHVDLVEVKRQNLFKYLEKLKEDKFCILGAEQTTNSKNLQQFIFPRKSAIVLGNEKEGIPASLLPVLDVCVEIPQSGVIRSLNVHVSASLLIWEFVKQHLFGPH